MKSLNTRAGYYAHASVGLLHVRPMVNLKDSAEIAKMRFIAESVRDLVMKYGGAVSGEHGDGLVRSCWNETFFGTTLYEAFREVKRALDPKGLMNPGKIIDAPMMTENLRYGTDYRVHEINTHFDFSADGGFHRAVEMCNGVGECRKKLVGTMWSILYGNSGRNIRREDGQMRSEPRFRDGGQVGLRIIASTMSSRFVWNVRHAKPSARPMWIWRKSSMNLRRIITQTRASIAIYFIW